MGWTRGINAHSCSCSPCAAPSLHHHRDHDTDDDDSVTVVLAVSDAGPALCPCGQQVALLSLACWLVGTGAAGAAGFCWFLDNLKGISSIPTVKT